MELTIVMPCLNEAETVATCVHKAVKFLADSKISGEVVDRGQRQHRRLASDCRRCGRARRAVAAQRLRQCPAGRHSPRRAAAT